MSNRHLHLHRHLHGHLHRLLDAGALVEDPAHGPVVLPRGLCGGWRRRRLWRRGVGEPVLVHDPVGLVALGSPALVEDERLLHADEHVVVAEDLLVLPRRLPVSRLRRPVRPHPRRILPILLAVEIPLLLPVHLRLPYIFFSHHIIYINFPNYIYI
ncbi:Os01g0393200 [Oryza sativa Japonica Group]|uniref:Os01g0393200 protein n=1 Tax=Oryza sativa subsp. japonica TaxID=39947 RepID=A0A0P0V2X3_ORYSJ|nr:hypothetical protein EE612_002838 [Oryza sativa]BAS72294.1 Os01g0393200 [Oryza sativa Japonica Group]